MNNTNQKISIIGGTGYLGKSFIEKISKHQVKLKLLIHTKNNLLPNSKFGDICNNSSLQNFLEPDDIVINFTGQLHDNFDDFLKTNLIGGFNLLNTCVEKKVKHIIFISTINVYGNNHDFPSKEDDDVDPQTPYSLVKSLAEKIYKYYYENHKINITIIRLSNVYGKDKKIGIIEQLISSMKNQNPIIITHNGKQERDFIYIDDAIQGIINALENIKKGFTIYNISSGEKISINNVIKIIEELTDNKLFYEKQNIFPNEKCVWGSNQKAKKLLKFIPKTKIREGLIKSLKKQY